MHSSTPHDLAVYVFGHLDKVANRPDVKVLDDLFQTLFLTSLQSDEGRAVVCSAVFVDPKEPDPHPPLLVRDPRWTFVPFSDPVDFTVAQLAKMALASDPASSALVVYPDRHGRLRVWGLVDQQVGFQSMLIDEPGHGGWYPPGLIQAQIVGVGHIIVTDGRVIIAELHSGTLVEDSIDVLRGVTVPKKLSPGLDRRVERVAEHVDDDSGYYDYDLEGYVSKAWMNMLCRILLRARAFGHGGAFLITDSPKRDLLTINYGCCYDRVPQLFEKCMIGYAWDRKTLEQIRDEREAGKTNLEWHLYRDTISAKHGQEDASRALIGAVALIASLSRIDGLVLLDTDLVVHGFGCRINGSGDLAGRAFRAIQREPNARRCVPVDLQRYGTRHSSMLHYCAEDEMAVGFVLSSDGPIRAITRKGAKTYLWDNVQLTGYSRPAEQKGPRRHG